jgi:Icc-related predicted phosphoesterase
VLIGGDIAPHQAGADGVRMQRVFLEGFLVEFARRLHEANATTELLLMMGNDDWGANFDCLESRHGTLWQSIHGRAVTVGGTRVAGSSWVPITPFKMKDWERWDDGGEETPARLDGLCSRDGVLVPHAFDPRAPPSRRSPRRSTSWRGCRPRPETVLVSHSPPRETNCDVTAGRLHVGSRALRRLCRAPPAAAGAQRPHPRVPADDRVPP